jgi:hypothetical protein
MHGPFDFISFVDHHKTIADAPIIVPTENKIVPVLQDKSRTGLERRAGMDQR